MTRIISLLVLALAACGPAPAPGYPPAYALNFTRACQAQGASAGLCACVWSKIEAEIPPDEFAAFERLPPTAREASPVQARLRGYTEACAPVLSPP